MLAVLIKAEMHFLNSFKTNFAKLIWIDFASSDFLNIHIFNEVRNSGVTKSRYETELRKMTPNFELTTPKFLLKFFFRVTNLTSLNIKLNFELTPRFNFYFFYFRVTNSKLKNT